MSADVPGTSPVRLHRELDLLFGTPPGWRSLTAVNHSIVGLRFIVTAFVFFLIGGVLAMLIRAQLGTSGSDFLGPDAYHQVFTMHGTVMMFLFTIPLIEGLALYMLPKVLGARDLAFPRVSAFGYWCYLFGGSILILSLVLGLAPDSGWFMYTPLSSRPFSPGMNSDFWLIGVTFVEVSAVCAAVEFTVTVLKVRAPGMALQRMPLLAWYLLVTAVMMLVGFPPLILGSVLLEIERAFDWPFFDPDRGGDPLLWQHLFWLFGHPEVYIILLPGAAVVSTVVPVFARHPIVGYSWIVVSIIALGFISFGLWVHHMYATGIPHLSLAFYSAASVLVAVPTGVQVFAWIATLLKGRPVLRLPLLYVFGFLFIFVAGGLTGVMVAIVPFDWQVHDTHFVVAHLHYVLVGGFVFPLMAGAYYWLPQVTGRMPMPRLGATAFWVIFIGFNLTFFLMHLTGLLGMPRRVYTYPVEVGWDWLNLISSIGGFLTAIGFALFTVDVALMSRYGRPAPRNPWEAGSLEWAMATPPASYNFASLPPVSSREPLGDRPGLAAELAAGRHYLAVPRHGWRETLGVDMATGRPDQIILLPGPTWVPLVTALATGGFFVSFLVGIYPFALVAAAGVLVTVLWWLWNTGMPADLGPLDIGHGERAVPHPASPDAPGRWGMIFTLVADGAFFLSLAFGYLFLWIFAPNWPPPALMQPDWLTPLLTAVGLLGGAWAMRRALVANRAGDAPGRERWLLLAAAGGLLATAALAAIPLFLSPSPTLHAHGAGTAALAGYAAFHAGLAALMALFVWARSRAGYLSAIRSLDLRVAGLWWGYTAAAGLVTVLLLHGIAWTAGR
ncbi:MAG TPA: cytochrome c oxidase subunit I [Geminicoccaceae bacterium]|nr:cytochrome c oxidase subunit I [Geminicoccaceae bacterium]